jgi:Recombinase
MPDTLTIAAAARLCGCPRSTLQRAVRAGRLHLDANHHLDPAELMHAGYLAAADAQQSHASVALQPRQGLEDLLRSVQRTMERLIDTIEVLALEVRQMQQERSSSRAAAAPGAPQPRRMPPAAGPPRTPSDVDAAYQRMRVLQQQGFSLRDIAIQLDREGYRTKQGRGWHKSTVSYVLRTHGR